MTRLLAVLLFPVVTMAANAVYVADTSAGANDGTSCANAKAVSYFNSSGNWSATPTGIQIGPDTTVHLCGTFTSTGGTTKLTLQGSGSSGHPVTILWETSAILTAPYWTDTVPGIDGNSKNYITFDGGTNGLITNTANGTGLANQQDSIGILSSTSAAVVGWTVQNLTITNLYVRTIGTEALGFNSTGISINSGGGNVVRNNTLHDVKSCIALAYTGGAGGDLIYGNTCYNRDAGVIYTNTVGSTATTTEVYNNSIGAAANWDDTSGVDKFHHDGIHFFGTAATSNAKVYNNYFYGDIGNRSTAGVFCEDTNNGLLVFNNVFSSTAGSPTNAFVTIKNCIGASVLNNTFVSDNSTSVQFEASASGGTFKNNLISTGDIGVFIADVGSGSGFTANNNIYYAVTGAHFCWETNCAPLTFTAWKTACSCDSASLTTNPNIDGSFKLTAGSNAIGAASNLTALNITALNSDKASISRGSSWDIGAYQYAAPPSGHTKSNNMSSSGPMRTN